MSTSSPTRERLNLLRRCVNDSSLPLDVRVAGALVLLFGVTISRTVQLITGDIEHRHDGTYARPVDRPVLLPPRLAELVRQLAETRWALPQRSAVGKALKKSRHLFPGRNPGQAVDAYGFMKKLNTHGITIPAARNSARRALAEELPAPVIAELFGMHIETAVRWTHLTQRDWTHYIASRAGDRKPETNGQ